MFYINVVALLLAAFAASNVPKVICQGVTFGEIVDTLTGGTFQIPGNIAGLDLNAFSQAASKVIGEKCKVKPYEDADACRNVSQMIRSRGFEVEEYEVTTKDGYILGLQRVINPLVDPEYRAKKRPILLMHEAMGSSDDWVLNGLGDRPIRWPPSNQSNEEVDDMDESYEDKDQKHERSLAFYFVNRGYDIFLGNVRGNVYGQRHVSLSVIDPRFWDFSLDEQIDYDLPGTIDLVQQITGHKKIACVGFSLGATLMFGLLSNKPEYADITEPYISMAPVVFASHIKTPATLFLPILPVAQDLNIGALHNDAYRALLQSICSPTSVQREFCLQLVFEILGHNRASFEVDRVPTILHHWPSGSSLKTFAHYAQNVVSRKFARYNLGVVGNKKKYGTLLPPEYNLTNIRSDSIILFSSENDWLADPEDVQILVSKLKVKLMDWYNMTEVDPLWNHADFCYHRHVGKLLNRRVFKAMEQFNRKSRCQCSLRRSSNTE